MEFAHSPSLPLAHSSSRFPGFLLDPLSLLSWNVIIVLTEGGSRGTILTTA